MTVSSSTAKVSYSGNGSTQAFAVPFYFLANSQLLVVLRSSAGIETTQVLGTNYTVTGAGVLTGGTVTMTVAPASGTTLSISRNVPLTQETDLQPNDRLPAETLEQSVDKLTMITQQIDEAVDRSIKFPVSDSALNTTLPTANDRANKYLRFTTTGAVSVTDLGGDNVQNVKNFGAVGDGVANDTAAINAAVAAGGVVYFPSGIYKCNITINNRVILEGDGSTSSILKPWDDATAVVTYKYAAMSNPAPLDFWTYHSEVRNLGFYSNSSKVGVGFTFAQTTLTSPPIATHSSPPALTAAGPADQYANNVKFYGCHFAGLEKGVLFPVGNIGSEFYSCGFSDNKYGMYTLSNKFVGDGMHAGNKYFYAGMFTGNEVGVYVNNTSNYGAINFYGTIFELNVIAAYILNGDAIAPASVGIGWQVCPVLFAGCWFEFNGATYGPHPATVTIDVWTGATRTTTAVAKRSWVIAGQRNIVNFKDCGVVSDINVTATNSRVYLTNCVTETNVGYLGGVCTVAASSQIINDSPSSEGGLLRDDGVVTTGHVHLGQPTIDLTSTFDPTVPKSRWWMTEARAGIQPDMNSLVASESFVTPATLKDGSGALTLAGTVVADGRIFKQCNEFTDASFTSSEYWGLLDTNFGGDAGWYAFTVDIKVTACADLNFLNFFVWNQNQVGELASLVYEARIPSLNKWYTLAGYAYLPTPLAIKNMYLDVQGPTVGGTSTTWRMSAFQAHRFDNREDAVSFLSGGAYSHKGVAITGLSSRVVADFSNATVPSRTMFQTSTTNGATRVGVIPNGTGNTTSYSLFNSASALNCGTLSMTLTNALASITSGITGSGSYVPLDLNVGGAQRLQISTAGAVAIGTTTLADSSLTLAGIYQSSSNVSNVYYTGGTIPSTTTSATSVFHSNVATAAAAFTLTNLYHFRVTGVSLGAGSAVTNEYGFHSNLIAGSGKYNFYAAGTAPNLFAGTTIVGTAALATTATDGFIYVPTCAGVPTGVPTTYTGTAPIVIDTTNNRLYFYSGGAWRNAGP